MSSHVSARVFISLLLVAGLAVPSFARGRKSSSTEPGRYKAWGPDIDEIEIVKKFRTADYRNIVVQPLATDGVTLPDKDDNSYQPLKRALADATEDFVQGLKGNVDKSVSISEKPSKSADTLLIRGKVVSMNPGSRSARFWSFGAGAAAGTIDGEIVDAGTGEVLAKFTQERRSGVGTVGGSYEELMDRNFKTIGEDVANILKAF